jgi:hypothetical protein
VLYKRLIELIESSRQLLFLDRFAKVYIWRWSCVSGA